MSIYEVTGPRAYREHAPGEMFEAVLDPDQEARAIRHGALRVVERSTPGIRPGTARLPRGWRRTGRTNPTDRR